MEEYAYIVLNNDEITILSHYVSYGEQKKHYDKEKPEGVKFKLNEEALRLFLYRIPVHEFTVGLRMKLQNAGNNIFGWT